MKNKFLCLLNLLNLWVPDGTSLCLSIEHKVINLIPKLWKAFMDVFDAKKSEQSHCLLGRIEKLEDDQGANAEISKSVGSF